MTMQKWIWHGLASMATLGSLAMPALAQQKQPSPDAGLAAKVNGKEITKAELDAVLKKAPPRPSRPPKSKNAR